SPAVELDVGAADLDPRMTVLARRRRFEAELGVRLRGPRRILGKERDVVEVIVDVGPSLNELHADSFAELHFVPGSVGKCRACALEIRDAQRDVLNGAALARSFRG